MQKNDTGRDVFKTGTSISDSRVWFFSLFRHFREFHNERRNPTPAAEITAAPVEVEEIWHKRQSHIPSLISLLAHACLATAWIVFSVVHPRIQKTAEVIDVLIEPVAPSHAPLTLKPGGGGGGAKAPTPASRGVLPRADDKQLVPPTPIIINMAPELIAEPTIVALQLTPLPTRSTFLQLGDPNGVIGPPSAGPGTGFGIGPGNGHGDGPGDGPGAGPGTDGIPGGPGGGNPVVQIGKGGASAPTCPVPSTEPNYTDDARKAHIQGTVRLDVVVNKDGTVSVSGITQRIGYGLDDEARQFVAKNLRCKPGVYQGQAVATPARIDVNFHLY